MCVYFKYRAFVCFPFNFNWSVVNSAYFENNNKYRLLNYPDGGMLNADSNADFVKLYQTSLPTRLHLTSMNVYTQKYSIPGKLYSVLRSSSLSIGTLYANRERKHSFRRSFINPQWSFMTKGFCRLSLYTSIVFARYTQINTV